MKLLTIVLTVILSNSVTAQEIKFSYPELEVTPLASETLKMAYLNQRRDRWTQHLPVQIPSLLTMTAGALVFMQTDEDPETENRYKDIGGAAIGVGSFWIATTLGIGAFYQPYKASYLAVRRMKVSNKRDELIRERVAEEALKNAYSLARKIEHLSVWSNFITSVAVLTQADSNEAKLLGVSAAIGSFLPYLFPYRWETTYLRHESYKKKIYGPIARASLMFNKETKKLSPGIMFSYRL